MSLRSLRALVGASLLVTLGACGSDSNGSGGPSSQATFPPSMAETFAQTSGLLGQYAFEAIDFGGTHISLAAGAAPEARANALLLRYVALASKAGTPGAAFAAAAGPYLVSSASCTPTVVGAATDTDADDVPDDMTAEWTAANCTVTDTATGDIYLVRGKMHYHDTSNSLYGFDMQIDGLRIDQFDGTTGAFFRQFVDAHEQAKTTTSGGTWSLSLAADILQGANDTTSLAQTVSYDVKGTYTSNGAVPATGPIPDGTITLSGTIDATLPIVGRLVVQLAQIDPFHYESSCGELDSGIIEARLNGSTSEGVRSRFIACGELRYEFLGTGTL